MAGCVSPPGIVVTIDGLRQLRESAQEVRDSTNDRIQQRLDQSVRLAVPVVDDAPQPEDPEPPLFVFPIEVDASSQVRWGNPIEVIGRLSTSTFALVMPGSGHVFVPANQSGDTVLHFYSVEEEDTLSGMLTINTDVDLSSAISALREEPSSVEQDTDADLYFLDNGLEGHQIRVSKAAPLLSFTGQFSARFYLATRRPQADFERTQSVAGIFNSQQIEASSANYLEDTGRPYGPHFKSTLPPGLPTSAPNCATKAASLAFLEEHAPAPFSQFNPTGPQDAWLATVTSIAKSESGLILNRPVDVFDIRPEAGTNVASGLNILDSGERPRQVGRLIIDATHRPAGSKIFSAYGMFQLTRDTFRTLSVEFNGILSVQSSWSVQKKWVWDVEPKYQIILPLLQLSKDVWLPGLTGQMPTYYIGLLSYVSIVGPRWIAPFFAQYQGLVANSPPGEPNPQALAAKTTWDSRSWLVDATDKHRRMINSLQTKLGSASHPLSLRRANPTAFEIADEYLPIGVN